MNSSAYQIAEIKLAQPHLGEFRLAVSKQHLSIYQNDYTLC
jgi:hypothetical protein